MVVRVPLSDFTVRVALLSFATFGDAVLAVPTGVAVPVDFATILAAFFREYDRPRHCSSSYSVGIKPVWRSTVTKYIFSSNDNEFQNCWNSSRVTDL
jgi:hypothetical protein